MKKLHKKIKEIEKELEYYVDRRVNTKSLKDRKLLQDMIDYLQWKLTCAKVRLEAEDESE